MSEKKLKSLEDEVKDLKKQLKEKKYQKKQLKHDMRTESKNKWIENKGIRVSPNDDYYVLETDCCNSNFMWSCSDSDGVHWNVPFIVCSDCKKGGGEVYDFIKNKEVEELAFK